MFPPEVVLQHSRNAGSESIGDLTPRNPNEKQSSAVQSAPHLQRDHVGSVLAPEAQVIHEELEHVKGLLLTHVEQQDPSHEAHPLAVAHLVGNRKRVDGHYPMVFKKSIQKVFYLSHTGCTVKRLCDIDRISVLKIEIK